MSVDEHAARGVRTGRDREAAHVGELARRIARAVAERRLERERGGVQAHDAVVLVVGHEQPASEIDTGVVGIGELPRAAAASADQRLERSIGAEAVDAVVTVISDKDRMIASRVDPEPGRDVELPRSAAELAEDERFADRPAAASSWKRCTRWLSWSAT